MAVSWSHSLNKAWSKLSRFGTAWQKGISYLYFNSFHGLWSLCMSEWERERVSERKRESDREISNSFLYHFNINLFSGTRVSHVCTVCTINISEIYHCTSIFYFEVYSTNPGKWFCNQTNQCKSHKLLLLYYCGEALRDSVCKNDYFFLFNVINAQFFALHISILSFPISPLPLF